MKNKILIISAVILVLVVTVLAFMEWQGKRGYLQNQAQMNAIEQGSAPNASLLSPEVEQAALKNLSAPAR
jgi:hypothetical protein